MFDKAAEGGKTDTDRMVSELMSLLLDGKALGALGGSDERRRAVHGTGTTRSLFPESVTVEPEGLDKAAGLAEECRKCDSKGAHIGVCKEEGSLC